MSQPRSIFGPLFLIAAGAIWLLIQGNVIPASNLWALTRIWPYLLIAAGAGMILKAYWKYVPLVLDVIIVGGAVLAVVYAPQLGWDNPAFPSFGGEGEFFIGPGIRGSGNVIAQSREFGSFDAVSVDYPAQVTILQGENEALTIEAEDNLLPDLKTQIDRGTLEIFYQKTGERHVNPTRPVVITITVKTLKDVDFSSAGELTIDGLQTDDLFVSLSGAGNLKLVDIKVRELSVNLSGAGSLTASGTTDSLDVNISGFGGFDGANLHGSNADVHISGAGSATVWVDDELDAEISGAGSVNYYGSAEVSKQINGVGSVNHLGDK